MTRLNYCYDCRKAHWASDCPKRNPPQVVTQPVTKTPAAAVTLRSSVTALAMVPSTKHCPTCTCRQVYKSNAERQKAYRERHKAK